MPIEFQHELLDSYLRISSKGYDESADDVKNYGKAIIKLAKSLNVKKVLCDETEIRYELNTYENYDSASFIAEMVSKDAKTAIVCKEEYYKEIAFWETVAVNRGFNVKFFTEEESAKKWLGV